MVIIMKVILTQDLKGTGVKGQVVNVADGFARNSLIPKGIAIEATPQALSLLKAKTDAAVHRKELALDAAKRMAEKLAATEVKLTAKAGANGKLFGSVTAKDVSEALKKLHKIDIDKRWIDLHDGIKNVGTQEVAVWLHPEVSATVKVTVSAQ